MIAPLQSLRFIFFIMIFLHHYVIDGAGYFPAGGPSGVSFFMILSGFVMSLAYEEKIAASTISYGRFISNRIIRLFPLHLLCLSAFILISHNSLSESFFLDLLPNLFLVQSWIPESSYYFSGNALSWFLSDVLFFCLVFPLIAAFVCRSSPKKLCIIYFLSLFAYWGGVFLIPESYIHAFIYINPVFRLYDFVLGMIIYKIYKYMMEHEMLFTKYSFVKKSIVEILSLLILGAFLYMYPYVSPRISLAAYFWIPSSLLILVFSQGRGIISKLLSNSFLVNMGNKSFSFYMIHLLAFAVLEFCVNKLQLHLEWYVKLPVYFVIILMGGLLISRYYEKIIESYLKRKLA